MSSGNILLSGKDNRILCLELKNGEIVEDANGVYEIAIPTNEQFILNRCSPYYKVNLSDANILSTRELSFDDEVQINFLNKALVYKESELPKLSSARAANAITGK